MSGGSPFTVYRSPFTFFPVPGQVSEWLKEPVSKTGIPATVSWVRIPPCPFSLPITMSLSLADRLTGCLLGQALGDAVGFVVEGAPPEDASSYIETWVRCGRANQRCRPPFRFGQYSDDTQLARELLVVFQETGGIDSALFALRVAELFRCGGEIGAGPGTRAAAERLVAGASWKEAATPAPYAGNGAAMRAGPLGLLARDRDELVRLAQAASCVTHGNPRCAAGAVAVAGVVALADGYVAGDREAFLTELAALVGRVDRPFADAIGGLVRWGGLAPAAALTELHRLRLDPEAAPHWRGITGHVMPSVLWSLYAFLRAPDDYAEATWTAIATGGDTDTTGAMTGAMAGARLGPSALPEDLVRQLTDGGQWDAGALAALARGCAARVERAN
jgi:ADP-ribosylglycohydrolase